MKFIAYQTFLYKRGVKVGEAIVMSETNVIYHLWESLRETRYTTEKELKHKYNLGTKIYK